MGSMKIVVGSLLARYNLVIQIFMAKVVVCVLRRHCIDRSTAALIGRDSGRDGRC